MFPAMGTIFQALTILLNLSDLNFYETKPVFLQGLPSLASFQCKGKKYSLLINQNIDKTVLYPKKI